MRTRDEPDWDPVTVPTAAAVVFFTAMSRSTSPFVAPRRGYAFPGFRALSLASSSAARLCVVQLPRGWTVGGIDTGRALLDRLALSGDPSLLDLARLSGIR
jgi:hypothetical protein